MSVIRWTAFAVKFNKPIGIVNVRNRKYHTNTQQ